VCLEPLVYIGNLAAAGCLYPAWRTARVRWEPDVTQLIRLFKDRARPIICFAWHAYELNGVCVFRDFPRDLVPLAIGHDGPLSRALQQSVAWYGFPIWVYRRRSPIQPKAQIINLLKAERPVIGVFVDSGGPDGQVRPGFLEVARAAEGSSRPDGVACATRARASNATPSLLRPGPVLADHGVPWPADGRDQRNARRLSRRTRGTRATDVMRQPARHE
jgi:hypothetical protein